MQQEIRESCCVNLKCNKWIDPFAAVKSRTDSVQLNRADLASWAASMLQSMQTVQGTVEYRFKGARICRKMWQRLHGVGEKTMRRALRGLKQDNTFFADYGKSESPTEDLVWTLLHKRFFVETEAESIADGFFHLQDTMAFPKVFEYVMKEWKPAKQLLVLSGPVDDRGPSESLVRQVWKAEFGRVKPIRKGDFAKCMICTELADAHRNG